MNYDAASRYPSLAPTLTPIYIEAGLLATLQREGRLAEYISVKSRPSENSLIENCVSIATAYHSPPVSQASAEATSLVAESIINSVKHVQVYGPVTLNDDPLAEGWTVIPSRNSSSPTCHTSGEPKLATANNLVNSAQNTTINSRVAEMSLVEGRGSIATVYHSPPAYQPRAEATSSVVNSVVNAAKRITVFERIASDLDAHFSKADLKLKAEKATSDFLDAMALYSTTDAPTAVARFETSMREIYAVIEKFKASTLVHGIQNEISELPQKMTVEKFPASCSPVKLKSYEKVKAVLELTDRTTLGQRDSEETATCRAIANQLLRIFQQQISYALQIKAKTITKELLDAAGPRSKITIAAASKLFQNKMIAISVQRKYLEDHDLSKDFGENINTSINDEANRIFHDDVAKDNMADWKGKICKLEEENGALVDETYPKDIRTPQQIFAGQLKWMKAEDFSNQIESSIKEIFPRRYECIATANVKCASDLIGVTKTSIESLKESLRKKCTANNDRNIATHIQKNRKALVSLLMADDERILTIDLSPNCITLAVNNYLESNETELDLAIGGMILDHLKNMQKSKLLSDT